MGKFGKRLFLLVCLFSLVFGLGMLFLQKVFSENEEQVLAEPVKQDPVKKFIDTIGETASELAEKNDLYASVMLAQAILESDKGRSKLAAEPNFNLFGIKGHYQQEFVEFETLEDDGEGNMTTIVAKFRKYPSYEASLEDYVTLLRNGVSWDKQFYEGVYKSNVASYREATAFLTGTYATDSRYEEKLNHLIEQYDLEQFDEPI